MRIICGTDFSMQADWFVRDDEARLYSILPAYDIEIGAADCSERDADDRFATPG